MTKAVILTDDYQMVVDNISFIDFITKDNKIIHLEHDDILTLGQQAQEWKSSIVIEAAKLKQKIRSVFSLEKFEAIDIVLAGIPYQGDK